LNTDASNVGIGALLYQSQNGEEHVIEYFSRRNQKSIDHFHKTLSQVLGMKQPEGLVTDGLKNSSSLISTSSKAGKLHNNQMLYQED